MAEFAARPPELLTVMNQHAPLGEVMIRLFGVPEGFATSLGEAPA